jgi:hypothetical protein
MPVKTGVLAEKTRVLSLAALCISIVSAAFSIFQWWNGEREALINVAINFSTDHAKYRDNATESATIKAIIGKDPLSNEELLLVANRADQYEYIAFLANSNRLDKSYLSVALKCDIILTQAAYDKLKGLLPAMQRSPEHQMREFSRSNDCELNSMVPGFLPRP